MLNSTSVRAAGCVVGTLALVGGAAAAIAVPVAFPDAAAQSVEPACEVVVDAAQVPGGLVRFSNVEGTFSFDQNTVTPLERIASMFRNASAALCASLPTYDLPEASWPITVGGSASDHEFTATVDQMAVYEDAMSYIMGCACASNLPGGGAIVNAEVQGVTLESIAQQAGALQSGR